MADLDREVAGLRCRDVLADLSPYLDGELPPDRVARVEAHLKGCDWCDRFGGRMGAVVQAVRRQLAGAPPLPGDVEARLAARLAAAWREEPR